MKYSRKTVYNKIADAEKVAAINPKNKDLAGDFLDYLESVDRSDKTIKQYKNDLKIFFIWNLENNDNKFFVDIKKRDLIKFQKHCLNDYGWSPSRIKRVKSVLSSLSNYIESFLDDEFEDFRSIVNKIESPANEKVREKSIIPEDKIELLLSRLTEEKKYEQACAVAIAVFSGMRKSEIIQMKLEFFNDDHLGFNGAMYITDKIRTKGRGKQGKQLNKYVLIDVKPYIDRWIKQRDELGIESEYMFVIKDKNGKYIPRSNIDYWTKYFSEIIEMPCYFHAFRHYTCSLMIGKYKLPTEVVRAYFGWSSLDMVSVYNDIDTSNTFGDYFTSEGIVAQESKMF